jgi:hypothetical protein
MFVKHFFTREIVFSWPERKQRTDAKHAKQGIEDAIGGFEREIRQSLRPTILYLWARFLEER